MIDAIRRDFAGHEELQEKLRNVPPYGGGDEFQDSLGEQMEKEFKKAIG